MKAYWLVPAMLALALGVAISDRSSGLGSWFHLRTVLATSRVRIESVRADNARLEREIRALESDPFARERAIREDLGLALPGEIIVRFGAVETSGTRR